MDSSALTKLPGIAGRAALVTGASRGIGRAIAEALAQQGAVVVGTATSEQGAAAISGWLGALSPAGRGVVLDVGSDASVEALFAGLTTAPEIVVNNAGITRDNLFMRMKAEEWNDVVSTNLSSLYRVCKAKLARNDEGALRAHHQHQLRRRLMGNAGQTNYAAAKAGMIGFTQVPRARDRVAQHHRERRRPGVHRHGHDTRARRETGAGAARPDTAGTSRHERRHRRGRRFLGLGPGRPTSPAKP